MSNLGQNFLYLRVKRGRSVVSDSSGKTVTIKAGPLHERRAILWLILHGRTYYKVG